MDLGFLFEDLKNISIAILNKFCQLVDWNEMCTTDSANQQADFIYKHNCDETVFLTQWCAKHTVVSSKKIFYNSIQRFFSNYFVSRRK